MSFSSEKSKKSTSKSSSSKVRGNEKEWWVGDDDGSFDDMKSNGTADDEVSYSSTKSSKKGKKKYTSSSSTETSKVSEVSDSIASTGELLRMEPITAQNMQKELLSDFSKEKSSGSSGESKTGHSTHSASFRSNHGTGMNENISFNLEELHPYQSDFESISGTFGDSKPTQSSIQESNNVLDDLSYADFEGNIQKVAPGLSSDMARESQSLRIPSQLESTNDEKVSKQIESATHASFNRPHHSYTQDIPSQLESTSDEKISGKIESATHLNSNRPHHSYTEDIPSQMESANDENVSKHIESATHLNSSRPHHSYTEDIPSQLESTNDEKLSSKIESETHASFKRPHHSYTQDIPSQLESTNDEKVSRQIESETHAIYNRPHHSYTQDIQSQLESTNDEKLSSKIESETHTSSNKRHHSYTQEIPSQMESANDEKVSKKLESETHSHISINHNNEPFYSDSNDIPTQPEIEDHEQPHESQLAMARTKDSNSDSQNSENTSLTKKSTNASSDQKVSQRYSRIPRRMSRSPGRPITSVPSFHSSHLSNVSVATEDSDLDTSSAASSNVSLSSIPAVFVASSQMTGSSARGNSLERQSRSQSRLEGIKKRHEDRRGRAAEAQLSEENTRLNTELVQLRLVSDTQATEVQKLASENRTMKTKLEEVQSEYELVKSKLAVSGNGSALDGSKQASVEHLRTALQGPEGERVAKETYEALLRDVEQQELLIKGYQKENERLVALEKKALLNKKELERTWASQLDSLLLENSQLKNQIAGFDTTLRQEVEKTKKLIQRTSPTRQPPVSTIATVDQDTSIGGISDALTSLSDTEHSIRYSHALEETNNKLKADKVRLEKEIRVLKLEAEKAKKNESVLRDKLEQLKAEVAMPSKIAASQPQPNSSLENLAKDYQKTISGLQDKVKSLESRLEQREAAAKSASLLPQRASSLKSVASSNQVDQLKVALKTLELFETACRNRFGYTVNSLLQNAKKQAQQLLKSNKLDRTAEEQKALTEADLEKTKQELENMRVSYQAAIDALKKEFGKQNEQLAAKARSAEDELDNLKRSSDKAVQQDRFLSRLDELKELLHARDIDEPVIANVFNQLRKDVDRLYLEATVIRKESSLAAKQKDMRIKELEVLIEERSSQWTYELRESIDKLQKENEYFKSRNQVLQQVRDSVQEQALKMLQQTQAELSKAFQQQQDRALELLKQELREQARVLSETKAAALVEQLRISETRKSELEARCESFRVLQEELKESFRTQERDWVSTNNLLRDELQQLRETLRRARSQQPPEVRAYGELVDKLTDLETNLWKRKVEEDKLKNALSSLASKPSAKAAGATEDESDGSENSIGGLVGEPLDIDKTVVAASHDVDSAEHIRQDLQQVLQAVETLGLGQFL